MLVQLHIKNFIFIEDITMEFSPQLNVLTGETGAGKSILIDSIGFVLGDRVEGNQLGTGEKPTRVEAAFELSDDVIHHNPIFDAYLNDEENALILAREYYQGKSRCWINNHLVTLTSLKEVGSRLVDIHGQYDHQLLLSVESHIFLLDRFAQTEDLLRDYKPFYDKHRSLKEKLDALEAEEHSKERELDLLKFQIDEIERADIESINEEDLIVEKSRLVNAEKLHELAATVLEFLDDRDSSASSLVHQAKKSLEGLIRLDSKRAPLKEQYDSMQLNLEEIIRTLREYQANLTFEPERLREIEQQADLLDLIKRKYGGSLSAVLDFYKKSKQRYDQLLNVEVHKKEILKEVKKNEAELKNLADKLSEKRKKAAQLLKKDIESELKDLNITKANFEIMIEETPFSREGQERVEFLVSLNAGENCQPLRKIISGGEASRVMLAMKKALMHVDPIPTLIFDEIDTNIGGRLGNVTGKKLREISTERQTLLITHLPQIASFADKHFKVMKSVKKGKTVVDYQVIKGEERVKELAQMMSGKNETEISIKHAEELLKKN